VDEAESGYIGIEPGSVAYAVYGDQVALALLAHERCFLVMALHEEVGYGILVIIFARRTDDPPKLPLMGAL